MANTNSSLFTTDEEVTYLYIPTNTTRKKQKRYLLTKNMEALPSHIQHMDRVVQFNVPAERIEVGEYSSHLTPWEHSNLFNNTPKQVHSDGLAHEDCAPS
jgi:hypothetical protein